MNKRYDDFSKEQLIEVIVTLQERITSLEKKYAELEQKYNLLLDQVKKDSHNSSKPPWLSAP